MNLRTKARINDKRTFYVRDCSICHYPLTYNVVDKNFEIVSFDGGCDCVSYSGFNESSWEQLEHFYSLQSEEGKAYFDGIWFGDKK